LFVIATFSLPSPMRPSRSHESLSSPFKPNLKANQEDTNAAVEKYSTNVAVERLVKHNNNNNNSDQTTPFLANNNHNKINNTHSLHSLISKQHLVEQLIKLDLNSEMSTTASTTATNTAVTTPTTPKLKETHGSTSSSSTSRLLTSSQQPFCANSSGGSGHLPHVHAIHNSLLNEENCFELKCASTSVTILNALNRSNGVGVGGGGGGNKLNSNSSEHDLEEDDAVLVAGNDEQDSMSARSTSTRGGRASRRDMSVSSASTTMSKYYTTPVTILSRYFMCRNSEERDKWIQCIRDTARPNLSAERHEENSLQVWLLEAKGQPISSKPNRKYYCEILLNNNLYARTCTKEKKDILFWGESFEFRLV
jgi:hypothetical protein